MLRREAVVDGDHDGGDSARKLAANGVVGEGVRAEEAEAAAVKENDDRQ